MTEDLGYTAKTEAEAPVQTYVGVIPKDLATGVFWPQIAAMIEKALPYGRGEYEIDDIRDEIERGHMFAIGVVTSSVVEFVATCCLIEYPRKRVLYIVFGAGRKAARTRDALIDAARILRADWCETRCRESLARMYESNGFDVSYNVCILETSK